MDLKDWVKTSEDEKTVTMKHPKGHSMTIAIKALPKIQAEQIKRLKLAKGGGVSEQGKDVRRGELEVAKDEAKGRAREERFVRPKLKGLAKGGQVKHYDEGASPVTADEPKPESQDQGQQDQPDQPSQGVHININAAPAAPAAQPAPQPIVQAAAPQPVNKAPVEQPAPVTQFAQSPVAAEAPEPYKPPSVFGSNDSMNPAAINKNHAGIGQAQQAVDTAQGKGEAEIAAQEQKTLAQITQKKQNDLSSFEQHTADFGKAVANNQIDEKHYFANLGTGQKIGNALGLFLGGLSVPFGGHNYAFDFINKQIDRDIDAQKARFEQQRTVLGAYQHLYGEQAAAEPAAKAALWEAAKVKSNQLTAQLKTPQAAINNAKFQQQAVEMQKGLAENAVNIQSLPGYQKVQGKGNTSGAGGKSSSKSESKGSGASGSYGDDQSANSRTDRILTPQAQKKYDWAMSKYNHVMSPEEKAQIIKEYQDARQSDKILGQIDELYPELMKKRTYGGYLAEKINPAVIGGSAAALAEGLGLAGAIPTAGTSLLAAVPGAIAAGAGGTAVGAGLKQGLTAMGGQSQTQYETAANSLESLVANALPGITPTERQSILKEFLPTKMDTEETANDKLHKLKQKIISLTRTPTLESAKVTRQK